MGMALIIIGAIISLAGGIWFLVTVFQDSVGWGVACLLFSPASLIYFLMNASDTWKPVVLQLVGAGIYFAGGAMMPGTLA